MKKFFSCFLASITLFAILSNSLTSYSKCIEDPLSEFVSDSYYNITSDYLTGITNKLKKLPGSGNMDIDYLAEEILLHRAILFTAHTIGSYLENPELTSITQDILDKYTGELREMRIELAALMDHYTPEKDSSMKLDAEYIKEYKTTISNLATELSQTNNNDSAEKTYINQLMILLGASNKLSDQVLKLDKNSKIQKTIENSSKNTKEYLLKLQPLKNSIN